MKKIGEIGTLKLFQADMTVEGSFDDAVIGCDYVFQVAAPTNLMSEDPEVMLGFYVFDKRFTCSI